MTSAGCGPFKTGYRSDRRHWLAAPPTCGHIGTITVNGNPHHSCATAPSYHDSQQGAMALGAVVILAVAYTYIAQKLAGGSLTDGLLSMFRSRASRRSTRAAHAAVRRPALVRVFARRGQRDVRNRVLAPADDPKAPPVMGAACPAAVDHVAGGSLTFVEGALRAGQRPDADRKKPQVQTIRRDSCPQRLRTNLGTTVMQ
jgi:hypothetical protein